MKSVNAFKRKLIQIAAFGFTNIHIENFKTGSIYKGPWKHFCAPGLNCYSCPAAALSCPLGALQAVSSSMEFQLSFYVTGFLLAAGVLLGRLICGFLCPFGLFQELLHKIPFPKRKLWSPLRFLKYIILLLFVILLPMVATNYMGMGKPSFCQFICPAGTLEGGIPLFMTHPELRSALGSLFRLKVLILAGTLLGCLIVYRFFCKALCPLGAIYGLLNKVSIYHLEIDPDKCISCQTCVHICKMDVNPLKDPDSAECIRCGQCREVCPAKAISLGFRRKKKKPKQNAFGCVKNHFSRIK